MAKNGKKKHKKLKIVFAVILIVLIVTPLVKADFNYNYNKERAQDYLIFDSNGYIQNQNATSVFSYGFNTSDNSGCGWIATYNVLKYLYNEGLTTINPRIEDVILPLDRFGAFGFGFLGTNPLVIQGILKSKGLNAKMVVKSTKFYEEAKKSDINIIFYLSKKFNTGHFKMMKYNESTDNFTFYNYHAVKTMSTFLAEHTDDFVFLITINA